MKANTPTPASIDAYIAGCPDEVQPILHKVREVIQSAAPEATEAIKYQMPTFVLGENLVHFAACKQHLGFYPTPSPIREFAKELAGYACTKGAVQFPLDQPIPYPLIKKITQFRVREATERMAARKKKKTSK